MRRIKGDKGEERVKKEEEGKVWVRVEDERKGGYTWKKVRTREKRLGEKEGLDRGISIENRTREIQ